MRKALIILFVFVLVFCFVACDMFQAFLDDDQPALVLFPFGYPAEERPQQDRFDQSKIHWV